MYVELKYFSPYFQKNYTILRLEINKSIDIKTWISFKNVYTFDYKNKKVNITISNKLYGLINE